MLPMRAVLKENRRVNPVRSAFPGARPAHETAYSSDAKPGLNISPNYHDLFRRHYLSIQLCHHS